MAINDCTLLLYRELQSLFCHFWQYFASQSVKMLAKNCQKWFLLTSKLPKMANEHSFFIPWISCFQFPRLQFQPLRSEGVHHSHLKYTHTHTHTHTCSERSAAGITAVRRVRREKEKGEIGRKHKNWTAHFCTPSNCCHSVTDQLGHSKHSFQSC